MNSGSASHLSDSDDLILNGATGRHHQISKLINHNYNLRHERAFAAVFCIFLFSFLMLCKNVPPLYQDIRGEWESGIVEAYLNGELEEENEAVPLRGEAVSAEARGIEKRKRRRRYAQSCAFHGTARDRGL